MEKGPLGGPFSFLPRILWTAEKVRSRTDTPRYPDIFIACIVDDETRAGWQPQIGQDRRQVGRQVRGAQRPIEISGVRVFAAMEKPADVVAFGQRDARAIDRHTPERRHRDGTPLRARRRADRSVRKSASCCARNAAGSCAIFISFLSRGESAGLPA